MHFTNDPADRSSILGRVIPKTQKMILGASLLNSQYYKVRIKGKWNNPSKVVDHHHHHHIVLAARISLTLFRHSSLSFIALGRSSGQQPVSSHSCWMYVRAGRPAFARPLYLGVAAIENGAFGSHSTTVGQRFILYIYIYIYIYIGSFKKF